MTYTPTQIDLSSVPPPAAIEALSFEVLFQEFVGRFRVVWDDARERDPTLPAYDVDGLEYDPAMIVGQAWSFLRLLDRARVNDAIKSVLAPLAKRSDLDNIAVAANVRRLVITPANAQTGAPAVMESDESLLRRYLLAFDRPAAGSVGRYLYEAWTAWPTMGSAAVVGRAVHGRRGDTDVVIAGPGGRAPSDEELAAVRRAIMSPNVAPEAISLAVLPAKRREYTVSIAIDVPNGPDASVVRQQVYDRIAAGCAARAVIGGEVPSSFIAGLAYGPNVTRVHDRAPVLISAEPYTVPVCVEIAVFVEARA